MLVPRARPGSRDSLDQSVELVSDLRDAARRRDELGESVTVLRRWSKVLALSGLFAISYAVMLLCDDLAVVAALGVLTGLLLAGLAFNLQHDASHKSFSAHPSLNAAGARVLDLLGMSSHLWKWKHNFVHHGSPNVGSVDDDVDARPILRLHPVQPWLPWHRFQHLYCWPSYALSTLRWAFISDLREVASARVGRVSVPFSTGQFAEFLLWKCVFVLWAILVPAVVHGWLASVVYFLAFELTGGFIAAVCFQLAHAVDRAEHLGETAAAGLSWEALQIVSTSDFRTNACARWFLGGLNRQTLHHLVPGVSHLLYEDLARGFEDSAGRRSVEYRCGRSLPSQLRSHYRFVRQLSAMPDESRRVQ